MQKFVTFLSLAAVLVGSPGTAENPVFYEGRQEGWFFYDDPETEPDLEPEEVALPMTPPPPAAPPPPDGPPPGSTAWLREAMPVALDFATDNPTAENVERYFMLQQQAVNKAERFSEMAGLVTTGHPTLDEGRRRPRADRFAKLTDRASQEAEKEVLARLFERSAIVLFLDAECSSCSLMASNLERMASIHGLVWRVVSMDGSILPDAFDAEVAFDNGIAEKLGVTEGGAMFLATPPNRFDPVSWNATAGTEVVERILRVAYRGGLLSEDEFRATRPVAPMLGETTTAVVDELPDILEEADTLLVTQGIYLDVAPQPQEARQ